MDKQDNKKDGEIEIPFCPLSLGGRFDCEGQCGASVPGQIENEKGDMVLIHRCPFQFLEYLEQIYTVLKILVDTAVSEIENQDEGEQEDEDA